MAAVSACELAVRTAGEKAWQRVAWTVERRVELTGLFSVG